LDDPASLPFKKTLQGHTLVNHTEIFKMKDSCILRAMEKLVHCSAIHKHSML